MTNSIVALLQQSPELSFISYSLQSELDLFTIVSAEVAQCLESNTSEESNQGNSVPNDNG